MDARSTSRPERLAAEMALRTRNAGQRKSRLQGFARFAPCAESAGGDAYGEPGACPAGRVRAPGMFIVNYAEAVPIWTAFEEAGELSALDLRYLKNVVVNAVG
jgi:hypothetical protein